MRGVHIVATYWFTVIFYIVSTERVPENEEGPNASETEENPAVRDHHTFVALIDIVFIDSTKRTCTGTIIHDYVVITAGHCFIKETTSPELTLSFIVIGNKRMFDSGYEQYLPIERYKIHPQFRGWTADLALVYTFAAMTSDKAGKVLHFASNNIKIPLDSAFTVLSWGKSPDKYKYGPMKVFSKKVAESTIIPHFDDSDEDEIRGCSKTPLQLHDEKEGIHATQMGGFTVRASLSENSRYLMDKQFRVLGKVKATKIIFTPSLRKLRAIKRKMTKARSSKNRGRRFGEMRKRSLPDPVKAHYSNWRRRMGPQQNNLTVETFSFINLPTCKRLVELVMPPLYEIGNRNDFVCYSSDDYVITAEDAGAPAVRRSQLYAVTVGGVDSDGEQVAVGMRVACFCSWIAGNLPSGGNRIKCCKNCCESDRTQTSKSRTSAKNTEYP